MPTRKPKSKLRKRLSKALDRLHTIYTVDFHDPHQYQGLHQTESLHLTRRGAERAAAKSRAETRSYEFMVTSWHTVGI